MLYIRRKSMEKNSHIEIKETAYRGVQIYYNKDWATEAVRMQRKKINSRLEYRELNINKNTLYFLTGVDENNNDKVYVGMALERESGLSAVQRLREHINSTEYYNDIWDEAIIFKFNDITADDIRRLENYFYNNIKMEIRLNSSKPPCDKYEIQKIYDKVQQIKAYTHEIFKSNIFIPDKKKEAETAWGWKWGLE
jgi:hypothetical protein